MRGAVTEEPLTNFLHVPDRSLLSFHVLLELGWALHTAGATHSELGRLSETSVHMEAESQAAKLARGRAGLF